MSFMGSYVRYRVALEGGPRMDVVASAGATPFPTGSPVSVHIPVTEAMLLAPDPAELQRE
jgi:hypothetical protein